MPDIATILFELFEATQGGVTVVDSDGSTFTHGDLAQVAKKASSMADPWLDLVTTDGEAIGRYVFGNPKKAQSPPTFAVPSGMVYLYDRQVVTGQTQGFHFLPISLLLKKDLNELDWYLPMDINMHSAVANSQVTLMLGRRRDEGQGRWKEIKSTYGQFVEGLMNHQPGQKDGPCFLQGESANGYRKSAAQIANYILGVDLDSGAPLEDVIDSIERYGLEAVIYTTHSHLKNTSVIKKDHFLKKMGVSEPDEESVRQYLMEWKGVLPAIVDDVEILDDAKHTEEGVVILVKHKPMPKFRAIFPLAEPFVFAKRGGSQQDAILEWKERYAGFCTELGFFFDEKCVDPARLFYMPRHAEKDKVYGSWVIVGEALDLDQFDRIKVNRKLAGRKAGPSNAFTNAGIDEEENEADRYITSSGFNLRHWAGKHAGRLEIQTLLEDVVGGDFIREPRNGGKGGVHVECPFEAEHSSFGGGGTFVVNASDNYEEGYEGGFTFSCNHNACAGRDRLDYLKELIEQELILPADLKDKNYLLQLEDDEEEEEEESLPWAGSKDTGKDVIIATELPQDDDDFGDDEDSMMKAFNRRYAVIRTSGGVRILVEPRSSDDEVVFESQNDVSLYERNKVLWTGGGARGEGAKKLEAFKVWLEWEKRRTYTKVVFAPGQRVPPSTYNLFRGWQVQPVEGDWSMLRGHIYENMCESNDELFNWFMTWMAQIFQAPTQKPGSTVVITGEKGVGKSTLFDYINQLLGSHGITVSQRKQIVGQFNGHLATTLLMVCEEAFWAADPQAEGVLKDMITNANILIEKKGYDPIQSKNYTRLSLISNSDWVVPASLKDERRFFVLRCNDTRRGDIQFFEKMREQMERKGGLAAMLYELLHWEPVGGSFSSLFKPPVTTHLQQQQIESLSGVQKFMLELVKSGVYETHDDRVEPIELNNDRETIIYAVNMRAAVEDYVRYRFASDKAKTSYDDISAVVTDWFGAIETKLAPEGSTNKRRVFKFPPLDDTRAALKEAKGLDIMAMTEEDVKALKHRTVR